MSDSLLKIGARGAAGGARLDGYYVGRVTDNAPGGAAAYTVAVVIPAFDDALAIPPARVLTPHASAAAGYVWWPAVDEQVIVTFVDGRIEHPVVMGALWDNAQMPPEPAADTPAHTVLKTKGGLRLIFDDKAGRILLVHSDGETALILDDEQVILQSAKDITIEAKGTVGVAAKVIAVTAKSSLLYKGTQAATIAGAKASFGGGGLSLAGALQLNPAGAASLKPPSAKGTIAAISPGALKTS